MKQKNILIAFFIFILVCNISFAQDTQESEIFTREEFVRNWKDNLEGYGIKPPVTKIGEWLVYVVNTRHKEADTLKVTRMTLIKIENNKHTIKIEEWFKNEPEIINKKDIEVKPFIYPLPWQHPVRCYREIIKGEYSLKVGNKDIPIKREKLIYKTDHVYMYKLYLNDTIPFGSPVKVTWIGPFNRVGDKLNSIKEKVSNYRVLNFGDHSNRGPFTPKVILESISPIKEFNMSNDDWFVIAKCTGKYDEYNVENVKIVKYEKYDLKNKNHIFMVEQDDGNKYNMNIVNPQDFIESIIGEGTLYFYTDISDKKIKYQGMEKLFDGYYATNTKGVPLKLYFLQSGIFPFIPYYIKSHRENEGEIFYHIIDRGTGKDKIKSFDEYKVVENNKEHADESNESGK